jgi:hypothetical protein
MVVTGCNVRPLNGLPLLRRGAGADERTGFENRRGSDVTPAETSTSEIPDDYLAEYLALLGEKQPDLGAVVKAWPTLPEAVKAGILAMVKASGQGRT